MGLSVFNTALNKVSKVSSFAGTGSQVIRGLKNPNLAQGVSGVLTALAGRSKLAKKLLTIDSKFKDILTKIGGIGDLFRDPKAPIEVWSDSPYSIGKQAQAQPDPYNGEPAEPLAVWKKDPDSIINQATARPDPQMNFSWTAEIYSLNEEDQLLESIYIEEISAPTITLEQYPVFRDGVERNYVSGVTISSINIKLYEDILGTAAKFMLSWANCAYSNTYGTFTGSFEYKKQIMISLLDPYGTVSARFVLGGCFPTTLLEGYNFTSGAGTPISPTATISVDTIECISIGDEDIEARIAGLAQETMSYTNAASKPTLDFKGLKVPPAASALGSKFAQQKAIFEEKIGSRISGLRDSIESRVSGIRSQAEGVQASVFSKVESVSSNALGKINSLF